MGKRPNQDFVQNIKEMYNHEMEPIKKANPGQQVFILPDRPVEEYFIIRRKVDSGQFAIGDELKEDSGKTMQVVASGLCSKLKIKISCSGPVKLAKENGLPGP